MGRRLEAWRLNARAIREQNPSLMKQAVAAQQEALAILEKAQQAGALTQAPVPPANQK